MSTIYGINRSHSENTGVSGKQQNTALNIKLRDEQWEKLEPMLRGKEGDAGARGRDNRLFIDAVLWISSNRRLWRDLPLRFGKWNTTYMRFMRWNQSNLWRRLAENISDDPKLHAAFENIVSYGDEWSMRIKLRASRRTSREAYDAAIKHAAEQAPLPAEDDSTLHWLRLVVKSESQQ
ncbi:MAG: transposase [Collimonas sp.]|uniref:transposase n=1 Tax=Collimonas sp. TaxID=1963772 RepID=UPI003267DA64